MRLEKIGEEEFRKVVYPEYKKLFLREERKPYILISRSIKHKMTNVIKIVEKDNFIGFFIVNSLEGNKYMILDYFAILPEYQNQGYGSKALELLRKQNENYNGIFIEIEKCGMGLNEEENKIREKRSKFYEKVGFHKLNFDIDMYNVTYSTLILPCTKDKFLEEEVLENIFEIYIAISGENRVKRHFRVVKHREDN